MYDLMVACTVFLLLHLGVSGTSLRGEIVAKTGEKAYLAGFALCVLATLIWMIRAYHCAFACAANYVLYVPPEWYRTLGLPVIAFAFFLGLPGMMMKNPTSVQQEGAALQGVSRITRHPFLWGTAIWAAYHLIGAGNVAAMILFLTFLILSVAGTFSIDLKCRHRLGEETWFHLSAESSNLPFFALIEGRSPGGWRAVFREYGLWRFLVTLVLFCGVLLLHLWLFSAAPLPLTWLPMWWPGL